MGNKQVLPLTELRNLKIVERTPVDGAFCDANLHVTLSLVLDEGARTRQPVAPRIQSTVTFDAEKKKGRHLHGEYDNADAPAIHQVAITWLLIRLHDNFWGEVARGTTHSLLDRGQVDLGQSEQCNEPSGKYSCRQPWRDQSPQPSRSAGSPRSGARST
jgi:hypothetical protein